MTDLKTVVPTLSETLAKYPCLKLQTNNKILCSVTGHEMSARADVVHSYITGKKFKKDSEWYLYDFSEFLPYIVPDKADEKKYMRCKITDQRLNRIPQEIKNHMSGKKFKRLVVEHEELEANKKRKLQAKADKESLWVPPEEEIEDEEEAAPLSKKSKKTVVEQGQDEEEDEEDNMSDLLGSDIGSDGDSEEDGDDDDEVEEEEEVVVVKTLKPSKVRPVVVPVKASNNSKPDKSKVVKSAVNHKPSISKESVVQNSKKSSKNGDKDKKGKK